MAVQYKDSVVSVSGHSTNAEVEKSAAIWSNSQYKERNRKLTLQNSELKD